MAIMFTNWLKDRFWPKLKPSKSSGCSENSECMKLLQLMLDGEASEEEAKIFNDHIEKCMPCYEYYNLEKTIKEIIQTKIERKAVPGDLVDSIKSKIKETAY